MRRAVTVGSEQELREWLSTHGIPVDTWGRGGAKRVPDLWDEVRSGETVLTGPPPERWVSFVSLIIRRGDKMLTEVGQLLATGQTRKRHWPPGEKMLPGESAEHAVLRCVAEELGIAPTSCRIVPGTHVESARDGESPSYPGLLTRYRMHEVRMEVSGLPAGPFSTREHGDPAVVEHYWDWL